MKIPILGMDPSLRNWGLAESLLDLSTGEMDDPVLQLVCPKDMEGKQVRQNSSDIYLAEQLSLVVLPAVQKAKIIFVEVPVGSKSARAMASYGICVGILGAIKSLNIPLIEVTAMEVKRVFTGNPQATKKQMIAQALSFYPNANYPTHNGRMTDKAEHVADALGAIHAGVQTTMFQNLMRLFQQV